MEFFLIFAKYGIVSMEKLELRVIATESCDDFSRQY